MLLYALKVHIGMQFARAGLFIVVFYVVCDKLGTPLNKEIAQ